MAERTCRLCGCTQETACFDEERGACSWVQPDLCSHCEGSAAALAAAAVSPAAPLAPHHIEQLNNMMTHLVLEMVGG